MCHSLRWCSSWFLCKLASIPCYVIRTTQKQCPFFFYFFFQPLLYIALTPMSYLVGVDACGKYTKNIVNSNAHTALMCPRPYFCVRGLKIAWMWSHHDTHCVRKWFCLFKRYGWPHTHNILILRLPLWQYGFAHIHDIWHVRFPLWIALPHDFFKLHPTSKKFIFSDRSLWAEHKSVWIFKIGLVVQKIHMFLCLKIGPEVGKVLNRDKNRIVTNQMAP